MKITIRDQKDGTFGVFQIEAQVFGQWAIHKTIHSEDESYTVTHVNSGRAVIRFLNLNQAKQFIALLKNIPIGSETVIEDEEWLASVKEIWSNFRKEHGIE